MSAQPILNVKNIKKHFHLKKTSLLSPAPIVYAVDGVSFEVRKKETLGLVGESGCGKSTLGRSILRLIEPTTGTIELNGSDITNIKRKELKKIRSKAQIIFQDPYSSLNPRITIESIIGDALRAHFKLSKSDIRERIAEMLKKVGIHEDKMKAYPHEFSGGQRQRIGIARALILRPDLIVCDEPVSALDVSIQAQVINLLADLKEEFDLSYVMIAHDLSVVRHVSDRIAVMYLGKIVELAECSDLIDSPAHPYTQALISAIPSLDPEKKKTRVILKGELPSPVSPPKGCGFHPRCPKAMDICRQQVPELKALGNGHWSRCFLQA